MPATAEELVPIRQAAGVIPGCPSWERLRKWWKVGLCNGQARLRLVRRGGRLYVSARLLAEFQAAVDREKDRPREELLSPREQRRRSEQAARYAESFRPPKKG